MNKKEYVLLAVIVFLIVATVVGLLIKGSLDKAEEAKATADASTAAIVELVVENGEVVHKPVADFAAYLAAAGQPVFVDFWATWCGPCVQAAPFVETLAKEFTGKASFLKVNVDLAGSLTQKYGIASIPNFFVFKDGQVKDSMAGYAASIEDQIRQMLQNQIG
jgi:thioredoxin 1